MILVAMFFSRLPFVRRVLLKRHLPEKGPTKKQRASTYIDFWVYAEDGVGNKKRLHSRAPGPYESAGLCAAETAFCLISETEHLKPNYGVVTPASVLSGPLLRRLPERGITFKFQ